MNKTKSVKTIVVNLCCPPPSPALVPPIVLCSIARVLLAFSEVSLVRLTFSRRGRIVRHITRDACLIKIILRHRIRTRMQGPVGAHPTRSTQKPLMCPIYTPFCRFKTDWKQWRDNHVNFTRIPREIPPWNHFSCWKKEKILSILLSGQCSH